MVAPFSKLCAHNYISVLSYSQWWAVCIKKDIQYIVYRYSHIFDQNVQDTYFVRILENIQYTLASKSIFCILSEYTLKKS